MSTTEHKEEEGIIDDTGYETNLEDIISALKMSKWGCETSDLVRVPAENRWDIHIE